jgi:hypothetical protein
MKVTVPLGIRVTPDTLDVTVAVKVTGSSDDAGFTDDTMVVLLPPMASNTVTPEKSVSARTASVAPSPLTSARVKR